MRLLVLGGTGRVGRLVIEEALNRHHDVTVLARSPHRLGTAGARVKVVPGDALDPAAVGTAVAGQDAVIYVLGSPNVRRTTLFSQSTQILLDEMRCQSVRRLVCVTGVGAGDTKGHGGFFYDHMVYPLFTKGIYEDKDRQERLVRESAADWTIVRPAPFRKRTPPSPLQVVTCVNGVVLRKIAVREVALFLLDEVEHNRYTGQAVFIGHP